MIRSLLWALFVAGCAAAPELPLPDWHVGDQAVRWETGEIDGRCASQLRGGIPVIIIKDDRWQEMALVERWWCIRHELVHLRDPDASEIDADIKAIRWLVRSDLLSDRWESELISRAMDWPRSRGHPSGFVRAAAMWAAAIAARIEKGEGP